MDSVISEAISGYLKFHLLTIGLDNGLFEALRQKQMISSLALLTRCDKRYLTEWCQGYKFDRTYEFLFTTL